MGSDIHLDDWLKSLPDAHAVEVTWPPASTLGLRDVSVYTTIGSARVEWLALDRVHLKRAYAMTPEALRQIITDIEAGVR